MAMISPSDDFLPTATLTALQRRAGLLQAARDFFNQQGYWEAQTPILSRDCCVDVWLDPFAVPLANGEQGYLQTSPEFALKRLICSGADCVFEVARVFRQDEVGVRHNPEFTMIEWYRRDSDHFLQMDFVELLIRTLHAWCETQNWNTPLPMIPGEFVRFTYEQAFLEFAGLSPRTASTCDLARAAARLTGGLPPGIEEDREGLLNLLLADVIEPAFHRLGAVFLYHFLPSQAALARIHPGPPPVAERFELYLNGMELCNGYHELTDAVELTRRMHAQNEQRLRLGKPAIRPDSRLLQAMSAGMPPCSGVALGFDRLAVWCLGVTSIRDVLSFPFDRA